MAQPNSTWFDLVNAVFAGLADLGLKDDNGAALTGYKRKWPQTAGLSYPCYLVCPFGRITWAPGSFETHELHMPVLVVIARPLNADPTLTNDQLYWYEQTALKFIDLPATLPTPDGSDAWDCEVQSSEVPDQAKIDGNANLEYLAFTFTFRTSRSRNRP